ncbi:MAG: hemerythrin family protein [Candidatus Firestonebacteria bacterium]|nr:hemerythrin family protein [Candidatus Firestonebacteria bacterium]
MAYIDFSDKYSVGIETIDKQHIKLINLINTFFEAMKAGKGGETLKPTLAELIKYTQFHFSSEENYMQKIQYSRYGEHKHKHEALVAKILEFQHNLENEISGQAVLLLGFLKEWLTEHILVTDKAYSQSFIENGIR